MGPQTEPILLRSAILEGFDNDPERLRRHILRCRLFRLNIQIHRFSATGTANSHQQTDRKHDTEAPSSHCLFHNIILLAISRPTIEAAQSTQVADQRQMPRRVGC